MFRRGGILYVAAILGLSLSLTLSEHKLKISKDNSDKGPCSCGIFETKEANETTKPVISKNYMNVTCNKNGTQLCLDLCSSLARASKDRATQALCQNLTHTTNLVASLYTKACDEPWQYSGMTADEPICCHDQKVVACEPITTTTCSDEIH